RVTPLSVWNAAAAGLEASAMCAALERWSRYEIHPSVLRRVRELASRFGRLRLLPGEDGFIRLASDDAVLLDELPAEPGVGELLAERGPDGAWRVAAGARGRLKRALIHAGWPARDEVGYLSGEPLPFALREVTGGGARFGLRRYQEQAVRSFLATGEGVIVLPCGAGKTVVGMAIMAGLGEHTLIAVTSVTAAEQWRRELLDKTTLEPEQIGLYTGRSKEIRPVTVATYQVLTHRASRTAPMRHLELLRRGSWGLVVYDEVHVLPAPVFQATVEIQARRRLGLSATLVREDSLETDVFALVGPKRYDVPWLTLEAEGWIAAARCVEVRVPVGEELRRAYLHAGARERPRIAADNPAKLPVVEELLERHRGVPALVIGTYVDQLERIAAALDVPCLTGRTGQRRRDELFGAFRRGELPVLVVSKVANYAVDLPDAALAIQVSGSFGSRQEEAQRLGRLLRPKAGRNQALFYTLVSDETVEREFAERRHLFLVEQGYEYAILDGGATMEVS
ncbi:MAG TPA: helicase, partial [Acidobacteria bacterium]|nr:helicase [Acidobacteriota bacterium]